MRRMSSRRRRPAAIAPGVIFGGVGGYAIAIGTTHGDALSAIVGILMIVIALGFVFVALGLMAESRNSQ
jgi:hypothetical protein